MSKRRIDLFETLGFALTTPVELENINICARLYQKCSPPPEISVPTGQDWPLFFSPPVPRVFFPGWAGQ